MKPKTSLTITCIIGLLFSLGMFIAPEFVTREQFPNAEGQGFADLVTLRYVIASLIFALVIITYHLREIEGVAFQTQVMRGFSIAFSIVFLTTLVLHLLGKISAIPPTVGIGVVVLLSTYTWLNLRTNKVLD